MTTRSAFLALAALLGVPGCFDTEPDLSRYRYACLADGDCLTGYVCRQHSEGKYCSPYTEVFDDVAAPPADTTDTTDGGEL